VTGRSQLLRRELRATGAARSGTLLALHSDGTDAAELLPLCAALGSDFDVLAPQAARSRNPFLSSASPDDPRWRAYAGFSWFRRDDAGHPEPASFGDSLWQVEQLVLERIERGDSPLYLVGFRDGATLALGAALALPELLDGVVAIDGEWPLIPGWSERFAAPADLPVAEIRAGYTDPRGAAEAVLKFLEERCGGSDDGRG
jgi:predicted esterase